MRREELKYHDKVRKFSPVGNHSLSGLHFMRATSYANATTLLYASRAYRPEAGTWASQSLSAEYPQVKPNPSKHKPWLAYFTSSNHGFENRIQAVYCQPHTRDNCVALGQLIDVRMLVLRP